MGQNFQPDFSKMLQGNSVQASDEEIMAEVRKVMMADKVEHPDVVLASVQTVKSEPQVKGPKAEALAATRRKVIGYQPCWSHNLMILSLAVIIYSPVGVALTLALVSVIALALYWILGADHIRAMGGACFRLFSWALPTQADHALTWSNRFSERLQKLVDWLPDRWTQGLYLPSFSNEPQEEQDLIEPFDRLLAERRVAVKPQ